METSVSESLLLTTRNTLWNKLLGTIVRDLYPHMQKELVVALHVKHGHHVLSLGTQEIVNIEPIIYELHNSISLSQYA